MRKFLTCLCIFTICLGIFTGCADNRVPQPDEGTTEFVDIDTYLEDWGYRTSFEKFKYSDFEQIVKDALRHAQIGTNFEFVTFGDYGDNAGDPYEDPMGWISIFGRVDGKPLEIICTKRMDGTWEVNCIQNLTIGSYWSCEEWLLIGSPPRYYDFYTGKELSLEEYAAKFPEVEERIRRYREEESAQSQETSSEAGTN